MENGKSTENLTSRSGTHSNTLLIGAGVITVVLSLVAIIIALVALSSTGQTTVNVSTPYVGSSSGDLSVSVDGEKIWLLSFEHTGFNYGYIDDATGELRGFNIDMATAVCQIANKNCQMVYDTPERCWDSQLGGKAQGGVGLMDKYYDACVGWLQTFDRPRTFRFSDPYTTFTSTPPAVLFTLKGNSSFDWMNLTGKTIGFVDGLAFDEHCIARDTRITGRDLSADQIRHYSELIHMIEGLKNGEVDAMLYGKRFRNDEMEIKSDDIKTCFKGGMSVMTRKDNRLIDWWNPAFAKLKATFQWKTICNDLTDEHGHVGGPDGTACV